MCTLLIQIETGFNKTYNNQPTTITITDLQKFCIKHNKHDTLKNVK